MTSTIHDIRLDWYTGSMRSKFFILGVVFLTFVTPIFGLKYILINGKLNSINSQSNPNGDLIDQQTLVNALLESQNRIAELNRDLDNKDAQLALLRKEYSELLTDFNRFKKYYFRRF